MDVAKPVTIIHHGAHEGVTGSCHEFYLTPNASVLIDCGQFQGQGYAGAEQQPIDFNIDNLVAVVLTHCHIDHVGRLPSLLLAGYRGPIYCTTATAQLLPLVLADAMKITRTPNPEKILRGGQSLLRPLPLDSWNDDLIEHGYRLRLRNAGHIMGSAYVEFEAVDAVAAGELPQRVLFSGDLGCKNTPLLTDPTPLEYADVLVLEATYGDRLHEDRTTRQQRLKNVIEKA